MQKKLFQTSYAVEAYLSIHQVVNLCIKFLTVPICKPCLVFNWELFQLGINSNSSNTMVFQIVDLVRAVNLSVKQIRNGNKGGLVITYHQIQIQIVDLVVAVNLPEKQIRNWNKDKLVTL